MKKNALFILIIFSCMVKAEEVDCENAMTTREINLCASKEMEAADSKLEEYLNKAQEKSAQETATVQLLNKSQIAWNAYRKAHCDAIYEMWSGGTISGIMFSGCMVQITKQRIHQIWQDYLTFMDSTPPVLPEPK